jgi:Ni,Fe-hydrogenase III small subunit/NAD-dependent dihydropyrimidine dehydrogenase PreA subunit
MFTLLRARLHQGYRTAAYPVAPAKVPDRLRGRPTLDPTRCPADCRACADACPVDAITPGAAFRLDLGRCLFCTECQRACPTEALRFTPDHRLATRQREHLVLTAQQPELQLAAALDERLRRLFGRSLKLRQVSAGGCNACEADINVLTTLNFDLGRFGIQIVASPRHADGLIITGPVTENMHLALEKTYAALAEPRVVIAVGACAIAGGPYRGHPETHDGAIGTVPVDLFIPGCPPHPYTILDGMLRLIGRLEARYDQPPTV